MADVFDSYLKGLQAKMYRTQLDRAAETDQAMRAMYGAPQKAPMTGGFLGIGRKPDPNFQPMSPEQGQATARALAPDTMATIDQNTIKAQEYQQEQATAGSTAALNALDALQKEPDMEKRKALWENTLIPTLSQTYPGFAEHAPKIDITDEGIAHGRAELIAAGAKDPANQRSGQQWGNTATPLTDENGNVVGFAQAGQGGVRGVPTSTVMSTIPGTTGNVRLGVKPTAVDTGSKVTLVGPGGSNQGEITKDLAPKDTVGHAQDVAAAAERGKGSESRMQLVIDEGRDAAKGIPTVRRALELMDSVKTGGFQKAALDAKAAFGVQGADEAELSSALGEAVLADLRRTFGAAFTEKEGAKLENIRAQFGASPEANRRLMQQALTLAEGAAKRAMKEAADSGDYRSAANIKETMEQSLSNPGAKKSIQERGDELEKSGMPKDKIIETLKAEGYGT
jgi:hypothetical protein